MKTIASVKLHKRGVEGIEIKFHQLSKHIPTENKKVNDQVYDDQINVYRRDNTPPNIMDATQRLKYFLLNVAGYWVPVYDTYMDFATYTLLSSDENAKNSRRHLQRLWDNTVVTAIEMDQTSFVIRGVMEHIEKKPLNLNPAKITPNDELAYYENARDVIKRLFGIIVAYFSTAAISDIADYKKYLISHTDAAGKKEIAGFDEEQIINRVVDQFSHRGMIVMMEEQGSEEPKQAIEEVTTPTEEFEPEPEEIEAMSETLMDEGDEWKPPTEKVNVFGAPASEDGQMEPGPTEDLHSKEVGEGYIDDEGPVADPLDEVSDEDFVA